MSCRIVPIMRGLRHFEVDELQICPDYARIETF